MYVEVPDINERLDRVLKILIGKPSEKENASTINPVMIVRGLFDRFPRIGVDCGRDSWYASHTGKEIV